jgi:hypothetical protein
MPNRYVTCASCDAMNPSFGETCDQCGAPLSPATAVDTPKEPVVRRTHFQRPTTIRLIGIWSIALPNVVAGIWFPFVLYKYFNGLVGFIVFWGDIGLTFVWFIILYRVTKYYFLPAHRH